MSRKPCQCIKLVNEKLADYNGKLETNWLDNPPRALISVSKVVPRGKKPPYMTATFCPFCGAKYRDARKSIAAAAERLASHAG